MTSEPPHPTLSPGNGGEGAVYLLLGIAHQLLNTQCAATVEQLGIVEAFLMGEISMGKKDPRPIFAGRWFKQCETASRCVGLPGALV